MYRVLRSLLLLDQNHGVLQAWPDLLRINNNKNKNNKNHSHDATTLSQAYELAEKIRLKIEKTSFMYNEQTIFITASFGISSEMYDINKLLVQADEFLYQSKDSGRNTISCISKELPKEQ